jgi:hypothetical protein
LTAVGVFLVLVVAVEASGRLPGGPNIPTQATTSTTQTTTPTTVRFSFSENGQRSLGKGRELTRASGSGTLTLAEPPTEPGTTYSSTSATGVITFHRWRVVGHRVIDEDDFTMDVTGVHYRFRSVVFGLGLYGTVTKAASITRDTCSTGSAGFFGLGQGRVKGRPDFVGLEMCGVRLDYSNGIGGVHAVVKISPPTP